MKIIFAGTPEFAAQALQALMTAGHEVALVLTQPDRPAGRGMNVHASPVKQLALQSGLPVFQPTTLKEPSAQAVLREIAAEVMVVAAYGLILPPSVLVLPRFGCLNIHASLLPRWRGAAPIQRALLAGDRETGVCIMQMEAGLDTGPLLMSRSTPIGAQDTSGSLHDRLAGIGASLIVDALARLPLPSLQQPEEGVVYAAKLEKSDALLDWRCPASLLERQVRAFNPFPGGLASLAGVGIKIWAATAVDEVGPPGEVLKADKRGIVIACGQGALCVTELQKAGGKRLTAAQFLAGHPLQRGDRLDLMEREESTR